MPSASVRTKAAAPIGEPVQGVWIVIPAHNEAPRIAKVLAELRPAWENIVVVDDGSLDETPAIVSDQPVWLLRHRTNLGQGAAIQTGIDFALEQGALYVVTFDADGQHEPGDIQALLESLITGGSDFALGSRFLGSTLGMPFVRAVVLRLGILFTWLFSGVLLSDVHNGFRAMTAKGARSLQLVQNGMEHASEIIDQIKASGLAFSEVPVRIRYSTETLGKGQRSRAALGLALRLIADRLFR